MLPWVGQQTCPLLHAKLRDPIYHVMHFGVETWLMASHTREPPRDGFLHGPGVGKYKVNTR